jgi:hypothetical protein
MFEKKIKLTETELQAKLNGSYLDGYNRGYRAGELYALTHNHSINQLRAKFGFKPIEIEKNGV